MNYFKIMFIMLLLVGCKTTSVLDITNIRKSLSFYSIKNNMKESKRIVFDGSGYYEMRKAFCSQFETGECIINKEGKSEIVLLNGIGFVYDTLTFVKNKKCYLSKKTNDIYCSIADFDKYQRRVVDSLKNIGYTTLDSIFHCKKVIINYRIYPIKCKKKGN